MSLKNLLLTLASCLALTGAAFAEEVEVVIKDFAFTPATVTIKAGDSIKWVNSVESQHTVTSGKAGKPDGTFRSKRLTKGESFTHEFTAPGTYEYFCEPHDLFNMRGKVEVR